MCRFVPLTILCATLSGLAGCAGDADPYDDPDSNIEARLTQFSTCDALRKYVADSWTEEMLGWNYYPVMGDVALESDDGGNSAPSDHSTTNVQEAGVDEPDLVKTDGEYIYALQNNGDLIIVDSWPAEDASVIGSVFVGGYSQSMFLSGDRILALSNNYQYSWDRSRVRATVIDISDRANPTILREIDIDGYLTDARMIDDEVYVVANHYTWMPEPGSN